MEESGIEAFDRLSNLPIAIIHHIMSFLPTTDATRVTILSKKLNFVSQSYPILDFDEPLYNNRLSFSRGKLVSFLDFMRHSLKRCSSNFSNIHKFRLCFIMQHDNKPNKRINKSICFPMHNLRELVLKVIVESVPDYYFYRLQKIVTPMSIVVLNLEGFEFKFEDMISSLTLVEDLTLKGCHVSSNFSILSAKLITLKLWGCEGLENIMIDAFNLQSFSLFKPTSSSEINIVDGKSLKNLVLHNKTITDDWLEDLVSKLLLLENLSISSRFLKEIKIRHQQLKLFDK
ncbi:F-box/LRR-repeat protein At4g14096-like [Castanea sativa]|uniref:F-box/LRR-repeat protein At4g14096-like n=1 Tax=Castanea sativa TaxID=21020 RepID=UPI003F64CD59